MIHFFGQGINFSGKVNIKGELTVLKSLIKKQTYIGIEENYGNIITYRTIRKFLASCFDIPFIKSNY